MCKYEFIEKIGMEADLEGIDLDIYVTFMVMAFPGDPQAKKGYWTEWAHRFVNKRAYVCADLYNRKLLQSIAMNAFGGKDGEYWITSQSEPCCNTATIERQ